jgi:hypothetical protein
MVLCSLSFFLFFLVLSFRTIATLWRSAALLRFLAWSSPLLLRALIRFLLSGLLLSRRIILLLLPTGLLALICFVCHLENS